MGWKDLSENSDINLTSNSEGYGWFSRIGYHGKIAFVNMLATLLLYLYRASEHYLITNTSSELKKIGGLIKKLPLEEYPFTQKMNNTIRSNSSFVQDNPKLDLNRYFQIVQDKQCTDIGEFKRHHVMLVSIYD